MRSKELIAVLFMMLEHHQHHLLIHLLCLRYSTPLTQNKFNIISNFLSAFCCTLQKRHFIV